MVKNLLKLAAMGLFSTVAYATPEAVILKKMAYKGLYEVRSINGEGNNLNLEKAGAPESLFHRMSFVAYGDQKETPASRTESPREISSYFHQTVETRNFKEASDILWLWGQFMDHDLTLTDVNSEELMPIAIPKCDAFFDLSCLGTNNMHFNRSESVMVNGVREQFNRTTAYIDGSMVYGENDHRALTLRANDDSGKMILDEQGYLPKNEWGLKNLPSDSPHFFVAGDIRANDHIGLMAMHNLFVREHNYWAEQISNLNPSLNGEQIYQRARAVVIAEIQSITFNEFLPLLVGTYAPEDKAKYNPELEAHILNEFSTAAFRMGHTFVSGDLHLESPNGVQTTVPLRDSFFNPNEYKRAGIDSILLGFTKHMAQARDPMINKELQNFLMVFPEEGVFDLFSFNIQRGRDHGIPSYNDLRDAVGFTRIKSFGEISRNPEFNRSLAKAYDHVDNIDPWLGLIAEKSSNNALLGATAAHIIGRQFRVLRDSDRFWFTQSFDEDFVEAVREQTLSKIIARNTAIDQEQLSANVFVVE